MTVLSGKTPSPTRLADAWVERFGDVIREAAGKDGRLTRREAANIDGRADAGWLAADNAVNWLAFSGQKTVSAEKLIRKVHSYVEREARKVSGGNEKVSLVEARALPKDIRGDFFYLRGKGAPSHVSLADKQQQARTQVSAALQPFDSTKLSGVPSAAFGEKQFAEAVQFPGDPLARAIPYLGRDNNLYFSVGATAQSPNLSKVGWYKIGPLG